MASLLLGFFFRASWKGKIAILVIGGLLLVLGMCGGPNLLGIGGGTTSSAYSPARMADADTTGRYDHCRTGEDANNDHDCARVAVENSLTQYWDDTLGGDFRPIERLTTFSGGVSTQCGDATSAVGPFYCPADEGIYLDTTFFDEVLEQQLGGPDGGFVEFYVLAHEYGHHISNITGFMSQVTSQDTGPTSQATRLELQADCFAGMWARGAEQQELVEEITDRDIELALAAASAVGDDHIQEQTQGQTNPETWNHGSSAQRMHWFRVGFDGGSFGDCDTFSASEAEVMGGA